jgi:hypothetical protein
VPDPSTTRLGLYKSKSDGSELVNYSQDIGQNWDRVDAAVGFQAVTSSTRPSSPYSGKAIMETDTSYRTFFSNGTSPASGSWVELPNSSGTFGSNLKLASSAQLTIGADVNIFRNAANVLRTNDALIVDGTLTASSSLTVSGALTVGGVGQTLRAHKTANETVTSSTTLQNDDHLTVSLDANSVYRIYMLLSFGGITAGELKTSWSTPSGATGNKHCMGPGSDSTARDSTGATMRYGTHNFTTTVNYGCNDTALFVHAVEQGIVTTTTAGTFVLQWAQQASSTTGTTIAAGSYLIAEKIA